jgi:hypothetical protein
VAGDVDSLTSVLQRDSETTAFPFRSPVSALQPEEISQPRAEAPEVVFGAIVAAGAGKSVRIA